MGIERDHPLTLRSLLLLAGLLPVQAQIEAQPPPQVGGSSSRPVEITFVDAGQGDAVVIQGPTGEAIMVDAGSASPLQALSRLGVDSLGLLVASRPHRDHIGGMDAVLTARPVARYLDSGAPTESPVHERLHATLERLPAVERLSPADTAFRVGALTIEVLAPGDPHAGSVGLVVRHGAFSVLLPGDAEREELATWLRRGLVPDVTVLKASDHGSRGGFTHAFVDAASPEVVVISVGGENIRGLPRPEALSAYRQHAGHVLRTDLDGHITVRGFPDGRYDVLTGETLDDRQPRAEPQHDSAPSALDPPGPDEAAPDTAGPISIEVVIAAPGTRPGDLNGDYATITNRGDETLDLSRWSLCDLTTRCFRFPAGTALRPGRDVVVYTGYGLPDGVSFFMNNDRRVWNENGDEATLYDQAGRTVVRHVY
ncbi:MAG: hypothetical protein HKN72_09415 [Gemmatimonadetes bacterium]|nr:hypothetical protein [Gemmatimonadota bacterium]NNL30658.1 hypothetical protein [Gemmatimonadota bacterium]